MPPFADYLLAKLNDLSTLTCSPVSTRLLADHLSISERTARWYARLLEQHGLVTRRSPKTGWIPCRGF